MTPAHRTGYRLSLATQCDYKTVCVFPGGDVCSGEPKRDAVHVVPDRMCLGLQGHEQVWRGPEEVPRD